ncbi:Cys-tRNA(Pro) deacylase [Desulfitobacterium sp.]|uniref:Cys-tRNA(Pro) deacylase n=1 Tax=Desulfitobacterium sp. TaxID=49981 RepID=UPI002BF20FB0|nr:Cys-tRNA(Pro) deacylase [Desulfitobacterium sp.]HVJ49158.1 Cys-tRNA(Pro) deacylase [Desulfitobacterium sp.]
MSQKTNAARILDQAGISYKIIPYEVDESDLSAVTVARKVGIPPEQIFKTIVARGDKTGVIIACIPADKELNLKSLAQLSGNKKVEVVHLKEVQPLTGYIRGGVSPLGTKKKYPVFFDETVDLVDGLSISAGMRGLQIFIAPEDLLQVTEAKTGAITA